MGFPGISGSTRGRGATRDPNPAAAPVPPAPDWPKQATHQIVKVVDSVRDATTGRALTAARVLVYGTVLAILAIPLLVLLLVGVMRLIEGGLLWISDRFELAWLRDPIWMVYLFFGVVFLVAGLWSWRSANKAIPATS